MPREHGERLNGVQKTTGPPTSTRVDSLAARLAWRRECRGSPVTLRHRLSAVFLLAACSATGGSCPTSVGPPSRREPSKTYSPCSGTAVILKGGNVLLRRALPISRLPSPISIF